MRRTLAYLSNYLQLRYLLSTMMMIYDDDVVSCCIVARYGKGGICIPMMMYVEHVGHQL